MKHLNGTITRLKDKLAAAEKEAAVAHTLKVGPEMTCTICTISVLSVLGRVGVPCNLHWAVRLSGVVLATCEQHSRYAIKSGLRIYCLQSESKHRLCSQPVSM